VYLRNLVTDGDESPKFNDVLASASITAFEKFQRDCDHREIDVGIQHRNHLFFEWQRMRAYQLAIPALAVLPELASLEAYITAAASETLTESGVHAEIAQAVEIGSLAVNIWTAVHRDGASHPMHNHEHSILSGVYYAKCPKGAGALELIDPREEVLGAIPKGFASNLRYDVKAGDLILFPPWLKHRALPTKGSDERVTYSFNVSGSWNFTADVTL
jgi:uncharacterized protein (TIGR02466 family)